MGNNSSSSCAAAPRAGPPYHKEEWEQLGLAQHWKPRAPGEARRALLCSQRRLAVGKMLHERLGDEAIWLEGELLEIIIRAIPDAGMCIAVGGGANCECETIAAALDAAQPGDTIKLLPGVYREPIVLQPSPSGVSVVGAGAQPSDVVVEWGDDGARAAGVTRVHNAGDVIEVPRDRRGDHALKASRATLAALQQGEDGQGLATRQNLQEVYQLAAALLPGKNGSAWGAANVNERTRWVKYCSPLRTHCSGAKVKNLTLRATGNSPAVFADSGGLLMEDVVVDGTAVLETHAQLRRCRVDPGVPHGVGVCVPAPNSTLVLESCVIKDCLIGLAITYPGTQSSTYSAIASE